jgi:hypothetical protein
MINHWDQAKKHGISSMFKVGNERVLAKLIVNSK